MPTWTTPSDRSTGDLITAAIWNENLGADANTDVLREGGIAMDSQAAGDVVYASSGTQFARVAIGSANKVLTSNGSIPAWVTQIANAALPTNVDLSGTLDVTGATTLDSTLAVTGAATLGIIGTGTWQGTAVAAAYGGTGQTSYTAGDLTYASGVAAISKLGIGANTNVLTSNGSLPQWSTRIGNAAMPTNVDLGGTLDVTGATTLDSTLVIKGETLTTNGTSPYNFDIYASNASGAGAQCFAIQTNNGSATATDRFVVTGDEVTADVSVVNAKLGIGTTAPAGVLDVTISSQAKTDTGGVFSYLGKSNEASNYAALQLFAMGAAAQADRVWKFQTIEQGVANAGSIIFQESGGKVGIGLDDPAKLLHIKNSGATYAKVESSSASTQAGILFKTVDDEWEVGLRGDLGDNLGIWCTRLANPAVLVTQAAEVGIGTGGAQPTSNIDLQCTGNGTIAMKNLTLAQSAVGSHTVFWFETDGYMHYMTAGGTEYKVDRTAA